MHPCPGDCVAIGHAVMYYDWAARAFSAGIRCRHCRLVYGCLAEREVGSGGPS